MRVAGAARSGEVASSTSAACMARSLTASVRMIIGTGPRPGRSWIIREMLTPWRPRQVATRPSTPGWFGTCTQR